jgi:hypothetical protein
MRIDKEPLSNSRPSWANVKGGARLGTFGVAVSSSSSWAMEFEKTIMGLERFGAWVTSWVWSQNCNYIVI